ncbi:MAG: D-glucuronyl C5-epimerase family protein [Crocinitomicaceae bacterium]|nr:D-glucuronyl C5-epimerase family protein [Crocinitomicaceae bacterium]
MKHKEESRSLSLKLGDISLEKELGGYYIDMRPAIVNYTGNIYNGTFDDNGVPMVQTPDGNLAYFPVNIAQYGFIQHTEYLSLKKDESLATLRACIEKLDELKTEYKDSFVWFHHSKNESYKLEAPWASAMAQGEIMSLFLRFYQISNDPKHLEVAQKAYKFLQVEDDPHSLRRTDENGYLWFEEYPSSPPSYVLNGFIYTIFGLYDLYRVTGDKVVKADIFACIETLKANLHRYDAGYWSYYDLYKKELVRYYYQKNVHVLQLEALFQLTKEPIFGQYAKKWKKTLTPLHFAFVQIMYRVLPRWRKLRSYGKY